MELEVGKVNNWHSYSVFEELQNGLLNWLNWEIQILHLGLIKADSGDCSLSINMFSSTESKIMLFPF